MRYDSYIDRTIVFAGKYETHYRLAGGTIRIVKHAWAK